MTKSWPSKSLSQRILLSLLTAGVMSTCVLGGYSAEAASGDYYAQGDTKEFSTSDTAYQDKKIVGGWDIYADNVATVIGSDTKTFDKSTTNTNMTFTSGSWDEAIGGNHIKQPGSYSETNKYKLSIGNTKIVFSDSTAEKVIGGSKANNSDCTDLTTGTTTVEIKSGTVEGGTFITGGDKVAVIGGSMIKSTGNQGGGTAATITAYTGATNVTISGGTFGGNVYGGSVADNYTTDSGAVAADKPVLTVTDASTTLNISGGEINANVIGAGAAAGARSKYITEGTATTTISGGTITGNVVSGGQALNGGVVSVASSKLTISGGTIGGDVYLGDYVDDASTGSTDNSASLTYNGGTITGDIIGTATTVDVTLKADITADFVAESGTTMTVSGADYDITGEIIAIGTDDSKTTYSVNAKDITVTDPTNAVDYSSIYNAKNQYKYVAAFVKDATVSIKGNSLTFVSANKTTNSASSTPGSAYNAMVLAGNSTVTIDVTDLKIGTKEQGGDRGIRLVGENNTLNINADSIIAYVGDEFVHVRQNAANSVANIGSESDPINYFEVHTTWSKDDYGVAPLQVNEGGTINFYANTAIFDGSTYAAGGVLGSGSYGTIYATIYDILTIDGNICGTYGTVRSDAAKETNFVINLQTANLDMKGDINAGSITHSAGANAEGASASNHDRTTYINLTVSGTASLDGNINAYRRGNITANLGTVTSYAGTVTAYTGGTINLAGDITFADATFAALEGEDKADDESYGVINLTSGEMSGSMKITAGAVNLNGATYTLSAISDLTTSNGAKLVLSDSGVISTTSGQIFDSSISATETDSTVLATNSVSDAALDKITFTSGTLKLTDAEYSLAYASNVGSTMKATGSGTTVVMTGSVADTNEAGQITVQQAAEVDDNVALDQATAVAAGNLLVGAQVAANSTTVESINIVDSVDWGFNVGTLDLAADSTGMVITDDETVTLGGTSGGEVITVDGETANVQIIVGTTAADLVEGTNTYVGHLNLGNAAVSESTEALTLHGSVTVNKGSTLNVRGNTTITYTASREDDLTAALTLNDATLTVSDGSLTVKTIDVNGTSTITGTVTTEALTGNYEEGVTTTINVGTSTATATTSFGDANLNGATLVYDPGWEYSAGQHGIVFEKNIDGTVEIGRNNYVAIGTTDTTAAKTAFDKTGLTFGENAITAVLYITGSQTLVPAEATDSTGAIYIDGSKTSSSDFGTVTAGSFTAADNSVTIVNASEVATAAAVSGVSSVSVGSNAYLYIDGAEKGATYYILAGEGDFSTAWDTANVITANKLLSFTKTDDANAYNVTTVVNSVADVYSGAIIVPNAVDAALNALNTGDAAYDFIMAATDDAGVNATTAQQVSALNSAANLSELAGVSHSTLTVSNILTDAVSDHLSLTGDRTHDTDIWAHYVHTHEDLDGLAMAGVYNSAEAQYNGIVVGADLYKKGKGTVGAALTYVDGNITGNTLSAYTRNDAEYYGLSIYGSIENEDSAVIGDISYLHGKHDITQHNSGYSITGDPKSDAFSIGVRAEKSIKSGAGKFVPYAGLRYLHLGTGNYTNSIGMKYDADDQNLFLLPLGVKFSAQHESKGWTFRPIAEVGYVWNLGDRNADQIISLNGGSDSFGYDTADSGSYVARLALEAEKANVTYGLGYQYQKGSSVKSNTFMAHLNWKF